MPQINCVNFGQITVSVVYILNSVAHYVLFTLYLWSPLPTVSAYCVNWTIKRAPNEVQHCSHLRYVVPHYTVQSSPQRSTWRLHEQSSSSDRRGNDRGNDCSNDPTASSRAVITFNEPVVHLVRRRKWGWQWTPGTPWCWRSQRRCFAWRAAAERLVAASLSARPIAGRPGSWRRWGRYNSVAAAAADRWDAPPMPPFYIIIIIVIITSRFSQAPTFSNRWFWRPSVPSTTPASHSYLSQLGRRLTTASGTFL